MTWMGIHDLPAFAVAVLLFLMLPGPGTFTLLTASGRFGILAGYLTMAGLMVGDQLLIAAAALGVAALLQAEPMMFRALQFVGAAYLVWVGLQLLRAPVSDAAPNASATEQRPTHRHFQHGLLVALVNPKAILFYVAFLPLFIDPVHHQGAWTLISMAAIIALLSVLWCSTLVLAGQWGARRLASRPTIGRWLRGAVGVCLVGFGLRLALGG